MKSDWRLWRSCSALSLTTATQWRLRNTLLSIGLVFSVATQLRLPNLPLGLGEISLLLWLVLSYKFSDQRLSLVFPVASFAGLGAILLVSSYMATYPACCERPSGLHDVLAYLFCAVLAINYAKSADKYADVLSVKTLWAFLLSTLLSLLLGIIWKDWSGFDAFYGGERWQHLSVNPNQFALLALILPFISIYIILRLKDAPLFSGVVGLLGVTLGVLSGSDALMLAWITGGFIAVASLPSLQDTKRKLIVVVLISTMLGGSGWQLSNKITSIVPQAPAPAPAHAPALAGTGIWNLIKAYLPCQLDRIQGEKNQTNVRFCLWRHALDAVEKRPLSGWGPGPHSGISGPFMKAEAHNTWLDWATQTGLIGMLALTGYMLWIFLRLLVSGRYELLALLTALILFSMFHFTIRQPLFWLIPLIALQLSESHAAQQIKAG